jgi:hypothetical protein
MFDIRPPVCDFYLAEHTGANSHAVLLHSALHLFNTARWRSTMERARSTLRRQTYRLLDLNAVASSQVRGRRYAGIQSVAISQIRGSMGRTGDFDHSFHPLDDRLRSRWTSVAMARSQYVPLPPVSLVQVGRLYFVEDGHHRISVARALGESAIDAEVTVWDVHGPLPWEPQPAGQPVLSPA